MPQITVNAQLGPSPKKQFLRDWYIAVARGDIDFLDENVTDDVTFEIVGRTKKEGKSDVLETIQQKMRSPIAEIVIHKVITHGWEAAVNGEICYENGDRDAFCEIYIFKNAKAKTLKSITSYVIRLQ